MNTAWTGEMDRRAKERKSVETCRRKAIKEHGQKKRDEERWTDKQAGEIRASPQTRVYIPWDGLPCFCVVIPRQIFNKILSSLARASICIDDGARREKEILVLTPYDYQGYLERLSIIHFTRLSSLASPLSISAPNRPPMRWPDARPRRRDCPTGATPVD